MNEIAVSRNIIKAFKVEITSAVGVVMDKDGNLLLGKAVTDDERNGKWTFPGGHIEEGESVLQASIRETYEETGIMTSPVRIVTVTHPAKPFVGFCILLGDSSNKIEFNKEYSDMRWFSSMPNDTLSINKDILKLIGWNK